MRFDGRAPGTALEDWDADERLARLPGLARPSGRTVVVAAHPDDETLGAGGLLRELAAAGRPADVVVVTDGAGSHPGSSTLTPADLVRRRADEVVRAVALLSPASHVRLLGFPDGEVREHRAEVTSALRDALGPVATVVSTWRGDGHRDHRVVGEVCAELAAERGARLWEYPLWMWHWGSPDHPDVPWDRLRALPLDDRAVALKRRAVALHATQTQPWSSDQADVAPLHPAFLRHADRDVEVFVVDDAPQAGPDAEFFDAAYARRGDPWRLETRWYERRKRALTLAALPAERYGSALEIGSSIGMLTVELGPRCERLLATDLAASAVAATTARAQDQPQVAAVQHDIRDGVPGGPYDLVVLSEVGYYLSRPELDTLAGRIRGSLSAGGVVLACHWRHPVAAHAQLGDDVHVTLDRSLGLARLSTYRDADVALDVWGVAPGSVARSEGLVP